MAWIYQNFFVCCIHKFSIIFSPIYKKMEQYKKGWNIYLFLDLSIS